MKKDVAIIGGSTAGLLTANLLAEQNADIEELVTIKQHLILKEILSIISMIGLLMAPPYF